MNVDGMALRGSQAAMDVDTSSSSGSSSITATGTGAGAVKVPGANVFQGLFRNLRGDTRCCDWNKMKEATGNFALDRCIGKGSTGTVYKAILDGEEYAVKVLEVGGGHDALKKTAKAATTFKSWG